MPNQSDPNQPTTTNVPPVINTDLPPLPPDFQGVSEDLGQSSSQPQPTNTSSSPAQPDLPPTITTPKKKFAGGRIIATILGVLILVGGVGAGILLTQQKQLIPQKAFTKGGPYNDTCNLVEVTASDNDCPRLFNNTGTNNVTNYVTHFTVKNITDTQHVVSIIKNSNWCTEPYGQGGGDSVYCLSNAEQEPADLNLGPGDSTDVVVQRSSPSGLSCGSFQTDLLINSIDGRTDCKGGGAGGNLISWGLCQTGTTDCTVTLPPPNPPTPPTTPGSCIGVKAYDSAWAEITGTALSALKSGTTVNFCAIGVTHSGNFDKAQFKINSKVYDPTTTKGSGAAANDFCQSYTIAAGDTTIDVKAKIHEANSDQWVGESFDASGASQTPGGQTHSGTSTPPPGAISPVGGQTQ